MKICQAQSPHAPLWLDLLKAVIGESYPDPRVYQLEWISNQFSIPEHGETWLAVEEGKALAAISLLAPVPGNVNPIANLGRNLFRPESFASGAAAALMKQIDELISLRRQSAVARVLASDNAQQILFENHGFSCVGFQPYKHQHRVREGVLFYTRLGHLEAIPRLPLSESLAMVHELAEAVLNHLRLSPPLAIRDGATGYPLQSELDIHDATRDDFELWRMQAQSINPAIELSSGYNMGTGYLRLTSDQQPQALLGQREDRMVAGMAYFYDQPDRCLRVVESFSADDLSIGPLLNHVLHLATTRHNALTVEMDALMTAPRLLKTAEQLGFVPVACFPAFSTQGGFCVDVIKLAKINLAYNLENADLTAQARRMVEIIDHNFQDQKVGLAVINLLRPLPIFTGLGDGELRKMARLCVQKLYRPGEIVFKQGDRGDESYVVLRGQVDIILEESAQPIATLKNGQIFGEQAFLDGGARVAKAVCAQPTILLVLTRSAFNDLIQHEPHLGMIVMRNTAIDLSNKLRRANAILSGANR